MKQHDILLESGNNEIEVFEFIIGDQSFGVNALKISELTQFKSLLVTKIPQTNEAIYGTAVFRGKVVPLIDIGKFLGIPKKEETNVDRQVVLFCEYNKKVYGFMIDRIVSIHRLNWTQIQPPHKAMADNVVTAFTIVNQHEISILDFETITYTLLGENIFEEIKEGMEGSLADRSHILIYVADDSSVIRKKVAALLSAAGYASAKYFENGQVLYEALKEKIQFAKEQNEDVLSYVHLVLTDIEMPAMDGLTLCKNLKSEVPQVPVLIMSSMINDQIAMKCQSVKADFSLSKSDMSNLPKIIESYTKNLK